MKEKFGCISKKGLQNRTEIAGAFPRLFFCLEIFVGIGRCLGFKEVKESLEH